MKKLLTLICIQFSFVFVCAWDAENKIHYYLFIEESSFFISNVFFERNLLHWCFDPYVNFFRVSVKSTSSIRKLFEKVHFPKAYLIWKLTHRQLANLARIQTQALDLGDARKLPHSTPVIIANCYKNSMPSDILLSLTEISEREGRVKSELCKICCCCFFLL